MKRKKRGFTLVEILIVLSIIAILAAILLPVFATARASARSAQCLSHIRQLGQAMAMYTADYDHYPRGFDPSDKTTPQIWDNQASAAGVDFAGTPLLPEVMASYVKEPTIWRCPSDNGFDTNDITGLPIDARPSCYQKFGMSYFYRTELTFLNLSEERVPHPVETNVLSDGDGKWHGANLTNLWRDRRYNVLFADGHAKNLDREKYFATWSVPLQYPQISL